MVYLANVYLEENKFVYKALQDIRGIGEATARRICARCGIGLDIKVSSLKYEETRVLGKEVSSIPWQKSNVKDGRPMEDLTVDLVSPASNLAIHTSVPGSPHMREV